MKNHLTLIRLLVLLSVVGCRRDLDIADLPDGSDSVVDSSTGLTDLDTDTDADSDGDIDVDTDLGLGPAIPMDCSDCPSDGHTLDAMRCAVDLCDAAIVSHNAITSPMTFDMGCTLDDTWAAVEHFGHPANDLAPRRGDSYALLATGGANNANLSHTDICSNGLAQDTESADTATDSNGDSDSSTEMVNWPLISMTDPWDFRADTPLLIYDVVEWTLTLTAPENARVFSLKYVFFSAEYDDFISSPFNNKFYILLNAPQTTGGRDKVINYTDCRDPDQYFDFTGEGCNTLSGYCCYVAINSALSDCCWYPFGSPFAPNPNAASCPGDPPADNTNIAGTGFTCASNSFVDSAASGSSTGWLMTAWPIAPGETFTLTFHIHDTNDAQFDSEVLLDSFSFHEDIDEDGGTIPIE